MFIDFWMDVGGQNTWKRASRVGEALIQIVFSDFGTISEANLLHKSIQNKAKMAPNITKSMQFSLTNRSLHEDGPNMGS